jgi:hypothetical protein
MPADTVIDWVHPSVRDTVIEYLMEHDAERQQFLRTANASGTLTALSTAGGAQGTLVRPLLRSEADWSALQETVVRISSEVNLAEHQRLLRGLIEAARSAESNEEARFAVLGVATSLLEVLSQIWSDVAGGLDPSSLNLFYELSVSVGALVPSPNLNATWTTAVAHVREALEESTDHATLEAADSWVRLVSVLRANEPRFLQIRSHYVDVAQLMPAIRDWVAHWRDDLGYLDEFETEWLGDGDDEVIEVPVQPGAYEEEEIDLLRGLTDMVARIADLSTGTTSRDAAGLVERLGVALSVRESRQERYEAWDRAREEDNAKDRRAEAWAMARDQGSGDFDIDEFFEDL